jgi:hypothetical protein
MLQSDVQVSTLGLCGEFPGRREKCREFLPIQPFSAKISLENICEFSSLRANSLCSRAENQFGRAGMNSPFWIGARNWFEIDSRAPTGIAEGRLVRADASIDSRGTDRLELSARRFARVEGRAALAPFDGGRITAPSVIDHSDRTGALDQHRERGLAP